MGFSYWPEGNLADLLDIHVQNYEREFREYWGLDGEGPPREMTEDEWKLVKVLDLVGRASIRTARALKVDSALRDTLWGTRPGDRVGDTARDLMKYNVAQDCAEIE